MPEVTTSGSDEVFLFQYGANMSRERLAASIARHAFRYAPRTRPYVVLVGRARLTGWRFVLDLFSASQNCLVADIVSGDDHDEVWGAMYRLPRELVSRSDGGRSVLDRIEGHRTEHDPANYEPITVVVDCEGSRQLAYTYVGLQDARRRCKEFHGEATASEEYKHTILDGARSLNLPSDYLRQLELNIERER